MNLGRGSSSRFQKALDLIRRPGLLRVEQMRRAAAVGGAEVRHENGGASLSGKRRRPLMFTFRTIEGGPGQRRRRNLSKEVDVPMAAARLREVAQQPATKPSGAKGAADIEIVTGDDIKCPKRPDGQAATACASEGQRVGAWRCPCHLDRKPCRKDHGAPASRAGMVGCSFRQRLLPRASRRSSNEPFPTLTTQPAQASWPRKPSRGRVAPDRVR